MNFTGPQAATYRTTSLTVQALILVAYCVLALSGCCKKGEIAKLATSNTVWEMQPYLYCEGPKGGVTIDFGILKHGAGPDPAAESATRNGIMTHWRNQRRAIGWPAPVRNRRGFWQLRVRLDVLLWGEYPIRETIVVDEEGSM